MATQKQRAAARENVKKAQTGARKKKSIARRRPAPRSAARARRRPRASAARRRERGSGAGAMTVAELRREAAKLGIAGRSKMGKAQLIRAVSQKRRSR